MTKSESKSNSQPDYEPEYDLAAAHKRNQHAAETNPKFKAMLDRLRKPQGKK